MALKRREKVLASVTAVLLLAVVGKAAMGLFGGEVTRLAATKATLLEDNARKRSQVARSRQAQASLADWQRRSLPSDPTAASSLYQNWLLGLGERSRLGNVQVEANEARAVIGADRLPVYHRLVFTVRGQGRLEQLVRWLYEFYRAGHLQKITALSVRPAERSDALELGITIEALSLPGSSRSGQLASEPSGRLAKADADSYVATIVGRNLFAAYTPPPPPAPPPKREEPREEPPPFDPSRYAIITAIVASGDKPQVWIEVRPTGEKLRLGVGDAFSIGPLKGTITGIDRRHVESEVEGKRYLMALGESLRDGVEIP